MKSQCSLCTHCLILTQLLYQQHESMYPLEGLGKTNALSWQPITSSISRRTFSGNVHLMCFPWAAGRLWQSKRITQSIVFSSMFILFVIHAFAVTSFRSGSQVCWNNKQLSWDKGLDNVSLHHRKTNNSPTPTPTDNFELFNLVCISLDS